jgi:hypothetical protein
MPDSTVSVELKPRCFAGFTVGGVPVEIFSEAIGASGATGPGVVLRITSPKKIGALRVYQQLPGFDDTKPNKLGVAAGDEAPHAKRA